MVCTFKYYIGISILIILVNGCQNTPDRLPIEKNGELCGITKGPFLNKWWQYYERGLSFAGCGFFKEAEQDFLEALKHREGKKDRRGAITYGMHSIDYFINREYGIILFHQGYLKESIKRLETSLSTVKTAKAEFFLDQARKILIEKNQLDYTPPEIIVSSPKKFLTNEQYVEIAGIAKDDQFVSNITIKGKRVRVDLSNKEIPFYMKVPILPGTNKIPIIVTDLLGKISRKKVIIESDRVGPIVMIENPQKSVYANTIRINVCTFDDFGIAELIINGEKTIYDGRKLFKIKRDVFLKPGKEYLNIDVKDRAGNITSVKKRISKQKKISYLLAQNNSNSSRIMSDFSYQLVSNDNVPPEIWLKHPPNENLSTYNERVFINGSVRDEGGIKSLFFSGDDDMKNYNISSYKSKKYTFTYFSYLHYLKEGKNTISINCRDLSGNSVVKNIIINKIIPNVSKTEYSSRVIIAQDPSVKSVRFNAFKDFLNTALEKRFKVEKIKLEEKFDEKKSLKKMKPIEYAKKNKLDYIILCQILETSKEAEKSIDITVELYDPEEKLDPNPITVTVYYNYIADDGKLQTLAEGIKNKLSDELPRVKGKIIKIIEKQIVVDICNREKIKSGMKLIVYELDKIGYLTPEEKIIGHARITKVFQDWSYADLYKNKVNKEIKPTQLVITK